MKIYILPVPIDSQPESKITTYPQHNLDYGVEQDYLKYLRKSPHLISNDPKEASWHYLPIYWTRWHVNHGYALRGLKELGKIADKSIINPEKTFTVCQYDDGPVVGLGKSKVFLSSRMTDDGIDIPLLSTSHKTPVFRPRKKYLASFMGRVSTHAIRKKMKQEMKNNKDIRIIDGNFGTKKYVNNILKSYISLCPRGYGGSSFRFYESMQLGVVPMLIGDIDTRPFKNKISWAEVSFYAKNSREAIDIINIQSKDRLVDMGNRAKDLYDTDLGYQRWCKYIQNELQ